MKEPNIRLRALELEDLDFLYQIENDDRLWELGVSNVPYSRRVLLDYITSASADIYVDNQVRLIVENEQNEQVGILDLTDFDPRHHRAELGIVIKKEFHGAGLREGFCVTLVAICSECTSSSADLCYCRYQKPKSG